MPVWVLAPAPPIQCCTDVPRKAVRDDSGTWVLAAHVESSMGAFLDLGFGLTIVKPKLFQNEPVDRRSLCHPTFQINKSNLTYM